MQSSVFTTMMRSEYLKAMLAQQGKPAAPWQNFTTTIDSTARIEQYPWMSAVPNLSRYKGHRRWADVSSVNYTVENYEFDASFKVKTRDIEDDQVGGYKLQPQQMVKNASEYPGRYLMTHLKYGKVYKGFDGTAFFADSHAIGTGDNLMSMTGSGTVDGSKHNLVLLNKSGLVKPLIFQKRKALTDLQTNDGSPESREAKEIKYWLDTEFAAAYGFWWDAILMEITNIPTLTELQTALGLMENQMRSFANPVALPTDEVEYVHEMWMPSPDNTTVLCSTTISNQMRIILTNGTIVNAGAAVDNVYKNWAELIPVPQFNGAIPVVAPTTD